MIKNIKASYVLLSLIAFSTLSYTACSQNQQGKIDRKNLVERHNVKITKADSLSSLTVGNGEFAMTVDVTGLQSFPEFYSRGVPLGTQSEWGWDSFKNTEDYKVEESLKDYDQYGRKVSYMVQRKEPERSKETSDWFRVNAHRLQLGNFGLEFYDAKGNMLPISAIKNIKQELNMYTGIIHSEYEVNGEKVVVETLGNPKEDGVYAKIESNLIKQGKLKVKLRLPYPNGAWKDAGDYYEHDDLHQSTVVTQTKSNATIKHQLQGTTYFATLNWDGSADIAEKQKHYFLITPDKNKTEFAINIRFSPEKKTSKVDLASMENESKNAWKAYWESGAAVDFSACTNPKAKELERRVVLSQYLMRVQEAGHFPPQETGLTYNSWFGKQHLEMHWWHAIHYALWGRPELLDKSASWYFKAEDNAKAIAKRQGFEGVRWQKMTDNDGNECPSSVGAMLIWQQPHPITYAELLYRNKTDKTVLEKYKDIVFQTADFMASFAHLNPKTNKYDLGPVLIPAQERFKAEDTFNPTYELAYWKWALQTAQEWRTRLGLPRDKKWDDVINNIAPLPVQNNVYLAAESATDSYTNPEYKTDHPSVFGAFGMLPQTGMVDSTIMKNTFNLIWKDWSWKETWGWDFPMTAMTAARLGMPNKAVDALFMDVPTNTYLVNGHNYQEERLSIYMPGNGGLLTAIAMMCAGWDGNTVNNPGFPKDGTWNVRWEGLQKMP
ncbi:MAG TPA: hypothetical protein VL125_05875 [Pelobium sp.]|nr:hypothetical protein [Pelobium sp.]